METAVAFALGVLVIAIGLIVSIAIHEWGHYFPAKKLGVYISQLMIGFGPTLFSRMRGETEVGIKAIPLGGYVAMAGMYSPGASESASAVSTTGFLDTVTGEGPVPDGDLPLDIEERSFYRLPLYQRIIIMLGGPVMNLVVAIALYALVLVGVWRSGVEPEGGFCLGVCVGGNGNQDRMPTWRRGRTGCCGGDSSR